MIYRDNSPNRDKKKLQRRSVKIRDNEEEELIDWSQFETDIDQSDVAQLGIIQSEIDIENENNQSETAVKEFLIQSVSTSPSQLQNENNVGNFSEIGKINSINPYHCLDVTKVQRQHNSLTNGEFSFENKNGDHHEKKSGGSAIDKPDDEVNNNIAISFYPGDFLESFAVINQHLDRIQNQNECPIKRSDTDTDTPLQSRRFSTVSSEFYESDGLSIQNDTEEVGNSKSGKRRNSIQKLFKRNHRGSIKNNNNNSQKNCIDGNDELGNFLDNQRNIFQVKKKRRLFPFMRRRKNSHQHQQQSDYPPLPTKTKQNENSSLSSFEMLENDDNRVESRELKEEKAGNEPFDILRETPTQFEYSVDNREIPGTTFQENLTTPIQNESTSLQFCPTVYDELKLNYIQANPNSENDLHSKKEELLAKHLFVKLGKTIESFSNKKQLIQIGQNLLQRFKLNITQEDLVRFLTSHDEELPNLAPNKEGHASKMSQLLSKAVLLILRKRWIALEEMGDEISTNQKKDNLKLANQITDRGKKTNQDQESGYCRTQSISGDLTSENPDIVHNGDSSDKALGVCHYPCDERKSQKKLDLMKALLKKSGNNAIQTRIECNKEPQEKVSMDLLIKFATHPFL